MVNVSRLFIALCPNERASNASPWHSCFVPAKDEDMRNFRDAKAMAHTLRAALGARGHKITISQSLELIAQAFGVADWNTLAAAIRGEALAARNKPVPPPLFDAASDAGLPPSASFAATLHRALGHANQRKHQYATLEHLLLALIDDEDASAVLRACNADPGALGEKLLSYLDSGLKDLVSDDGGNAKPTAGFQRAVQRAGRQAQELGRRGVTGANALVGLFAESRSPAARLLAEQGITAQDAVNVIAGGIDRRTGDAGPGR
jgi:hypothetical protein